MCCTHHAIIVMIRYSCDGRFTVCSCCHRIHVSEVLMYSLFATEAITIICGLLILLRFPFSFDSLADIDIDFKCVSFHSDS